MTETIERVAALETNQAGFLKLADKWDKMLEKVTEINVNLSNHIRQQETYQKNCETERSAHGQRLGAVEKAVEAMAKLADVVTDHATKLSTIQSQIARGNTVWWTIFKMAAIVGGLAAFAVSVVTLWATVWRH